MMLFFSNLWVQLIGTNYTTDAVDDRKILPLIEEWLSQLNATQMDNEGKPTLKQQRKPFYAQWYQTNAQ